MFKVNNKDTRSPRMANKGVKIKNNGVDLASLLLTLNICHTLFQNFPILYNFFWKLGNKPAIGSLEPRAFCASNMVMARSSRPELFCKKGVLKNFWKIHRNTYTCARISCFYDKEIYKHIL